jgi:hypothetical protein
MGKFSGYGWRIKVRWAMPFLFVAASVFPYQVLGSLSSLDPLPP